MLFVPHTHINFLLIFICLKKYFNWILHFSSRNQKLWNPISLTFFHCYFQILNEFKTKNLSCIYFFNIWKWYSLDELEYNSGIRLTHVMGYSIIHQLNTYLSNSYYIFISIYIKYKVIVTFGGNMFSSCKRSSVVRYSVYNIPSNCVSLDKLINLSLPQLPYDKNRN